MKVYFEDQVYEIGPNGKDSQEFGGAHMFMHNGEHYSLVEEILNTVPVNKYEYETVCYMEGQAPFTTPDEIVLHWVTLVTSRDQYEMLPTDAGVSVMFAPEHVGVRLCGILNTFVSHGEIPRPKSPDILDPYLPTWEEAEAPHKFLKEQMGQTPVISDEERIQVVRSRFSSVISNVGDAYEDESSEMTPEEHDDIIRYAIGVRNTLLMAYGGMV